MGETVLPAIMNWIQMFMSELNSHDWIIAGVSFLAMFLGLLYYDLIAFMFRKLVMREFWDYSLKPKVISNKQASIKQLASYKKYGTPKGG